MGWTTDAFSGADATPIRSQVGRRRREPQYDEFGDLIPDDDMQWTDDDWQAYQDAYNENQDDNEYTPEEIARWEQNRRERRRARAQRQLSMSATPSADDNLNGPAPAG